jgi:hypothetical protein
MNSDSRQKSASFPPGEAETELYVIVGICKSEMKSCCYLALMCGPEEPLITVVKPF